MLGLNGSTGGGGLSVPQFSPCLCPILSESFHTPCSRLIRTGPPWQVEIPYNGGGSGLLAQPLWLMVSGLGLRGVWEAGQAAMDRASWEPGQGLVCRVSLLP